MARRGALSGFLLWILGGAVVILRYGAGDGRSRTLLEVGKELGISRERVRQLEMVALANLRGGARSISLRDLA